jgi:hypothetical protein
MADRDEQAAAAYREHRLEDQRDWYETRVGEFEAAIRQLGFVTALLLFAATVVSVVGAAGVGDKWLAVAGTAIPALAAAVTAYGALQAYDRLHRAYEGTARALGGLITDPRPDLASQVAAAESVMRVEQGQWGQLISEIPEVRPPAQ